MPQAERAMAIENLLGSLERRVAEREAAIARAAEDAAAELVAEADRAVTAEREAFQREREAALTREADIAITAARRETTKETLLAREQLLARVFTAASAQIAGLARDARYLDTLAERVRVARAFVGEREAVVRCTPGLATRLESFADGMRIEASADVGTGFVIETADGSLTVNDVLERALTRRRGDLAARVLERFEELVPWDATSAT
ncbi:MAG TPA: V-type ATP synthase subunit E family protein [Gemmatimonadales bacterium]|nr:V-type ATP synthase subunit E family protein [Gemmatimonadales bacterium]